MKRNLLLFVFIVSSSLSITAQVAQLWGVNSYGGTYGGGSIFKINEDGTAFTSVFHFDSNSGTVPRTGLCLAGNGKLYGVTNNDGANSVGTLFSFNPTGNIFKKIVDFDYLNGAYPWGGMMLGKNGQVYGTTYGGMWGNGNIFTVDVNNDALYVLYHFDTGDGASPTGKMVQTADGVLYGTTAYDGAYNGGTIFSYDISAHLFTKLYDFNFNDGGNAYGDLMQASDSNLYGMTKGGGIHGVGVIFKFNPVSKSYTKLVDFDTTNGKWPWNGLIQVTGTKLYGMTTNGGAFKSGVIFSYDFSSNAFAVHHSFDEPNGSIPFGSLMKGSDGFLYGLTALGGDYLAGTAFRFNAATDSFTVIHSFDPPEGFHPTGDLVEVIQPISVNQLGDKLVSGIYPNPSNGKIVIELEGHSSNSMLTITDVMGRTLHHEILTEKTTILNLQQPPGIYFLTVTGAESSMTQKIVIE